MMQPGWSALLLLPSLLAAQSAPPLTLEEAVRRALERSPRVEMARAQHAAALAGRTEAAGARFPQLGLATSAMRFEQPMIVAPLHGLDLRRPPVFDRTLLQGSISLSYTLFDGGARGAAVGGARAEAERARWEQLAVEGALIGEVARRYFEVLTASGVLLARQEGVAALRAESLRVEQALAQGRAARVQLLQVAAALAQARAEEVAASGRLEVARNELARALGWERWPAALGEVRVVRLREVTLPDREHLEEEVRSGNRELQAFRMRVDAVRKAWAGARAQWLPRIDVVGGYLGFGSGGGTFVTEWQFGLRLNYPVFTGAARAAAVRRAGAEVAVAEAVEEEVEDSLMGVLERALAAYREAEARVAAGASAVAHFEELQRIERLRLEVGAGTESDFLRAEAELRRAQAALLEARHALLLARIELARLTGELSLEWLASNLEEEG